MCVYLCESGAGPPESIDFLCMPGSLELQFQAMASPLSPPGELQMLLTTESSPAPLQTFSCVSSESTRAKCGGQFSSTMWDPGD